MSACSAHGFRMMCLRNRIGKPCRASRRDTIDTQHGCRPCRVRSRVRPSSAQIAAAVRATPSPPLPRKFACIRPRHGLARAPRIRRSSAPGPGARPGLGLRCHRDLGAQLNAGGAGPQAGGMTPWFHAEFGRGAALHRNVLCRLLARVGPREWRWRRRKTVGLATAGPGSTSGEVSPNLRGRVVPPLWQGMPSKRQGAAVPLGGEAAPFPHGRACRSPLAAG